MMICGIKAEYLDQSADAGLNGFKIDCTALEVEDEAVADDFFINIHRVGQFVGAGDFVKNLGIPVFDVLRIV